MTTTIKLKHERGASDGAHPFPRLTVEAGIMEPQAPIGPERPDATIAGVPVGPVAR